MTALPLATGSCDGAYATESLEHAVDIPRAVAELCRIVEAGRADRDHRQESRRRGDGWKRRSGNAGSGARNWKGCWRAIAGEVSSQPISYWEDVEPDGLFLAWLAVK